MQILKVIGLLMECNFAFFSGLIDAQFWTACATQKSPELTTNNN